MTLWSPDILDLTVFYQVLIEYGIYNARGPSAPGHVQKSTISNKFSFSIPCLTTNLYIF